MTRKKAAAREFLPKKLYWDFVLKGCGGFGVLSFVRSFSNDKSGRRWVLYNTLIPFRDKHIAALVNHIRNYARRARFLQIIP